MPCRRAFGWLPAVLPIQTALQGTSLVSLGQILRRATNVIKADVHILLLKTQQKRPTWGHVGSQCPAPRGDCACAHIRPPAPGINNSLSFAGGVKWKAGITFICQSGVAHLLKLLSLFLFLPFAHFPNGFLAFPHWKAMSYIKEISPPSIVCFTDIFHSLSLVSWLCRFSFFHLLPAESSCLIVLSTAQLSD